MCYTKFRESNWSCNFALGREDFPEKWPTLLTQMVHHMESGDFHVINGVLQTAHSLFKR